jgi:Uma2 family endonuclease
MAIDTDWTLEQFLRLPETKPALEFECGRITQKVSPTTDHAVLQVHLCKLLDALALGRAFSELRTVLPQASKVPDVAFYVTAELPISPRGRWLRYPEWAPTVAIEIASPDQDLRELRDKCRFYVEQGSRLALLVLPETEVVEVFAANTPPRSCAGAEPIAELVQVLSPTAASITPAAIFTALYPSSHGEV